MIELTAAQAAKRIKNGDLDAGEYFDFYRRRAAADALNSYVWVADETPEFATETTSPGSRSRSRTSSAPRASRARPARRSSRATSRRTPRPRPQSLGGRRHAAGQDQPGRVRDGLLDRELGLRPDVQPLGHTRVPGGSSGGSAARSRPAPRPGRSAPTPAARSASPPRCAGSSASSPPTARSAATG